MTGKPVRKSRPKKKPVVGQEWPDSFPRWRSVAKADVVTRYADAEESRRLGVRSLDSMFRRLEKMDFEVQESRRPEHAAIEDFLPDYCDKELGIRLYHADAFEVMESVAHVRPSGCVDLVATDPPYFLSNGGVTCVAGRMVSVNKGDWDESEGVSADHEFIREWLELAKVLLKANAAIWATGTMHVIFSTGFAMQELGYRILNDIIWWKTNPAPHLACRYFQHATETILWARKSDKAKHLFNYDLMKHLNDGRQMQNVWRFPSVPRREKALGRHPTQKPVALMKWIVECSTSPGDLVLDPFMGSGTTGVACVLLGRHFVGVETNDEYFDLAIRRIRAASLEKQTALFG